jgi:hypothetical protein
METFIRQWTDPSVSEARLREYFDRKAKRWNFSSYCIISRENGLITVEFTRAKG